MINAIKLRNFRNYELEVFEFGPGINIIVGPNAVGKTNLIEAILCICQGSSYRAKDNDLINFSKNQALVEIKINNQERALKLSKISPKNKEFIINTKITRRLSKINQIPIILFEPNDLSLISGPKENRRKFLDFIITQTKTNYKTTLNQYARTLFQRNRLLKTSNIKEQIFPWNMRLSQLAGEIVSLRIKLVNEINEEIESVYQSITGKTSKLKIRYLSSVEDSNYESNLLKALEDRISEDRLRGYTSSGAHREDFDLILNNHSSNKTASRGETRSLILTLKIIQKNILEKALNKKSIFLLDDVFSELDGQRRKFLLNELKDNQVFITTTDADMIINHLNRKYQIIPISN